MPGVRSGVAAQLDARHPTIGRGQGVTVKKMLTVVVAAVAGFAVWRKLEADKAEQALWAEVTDPIK